MNNDRAPKTTLAGPIVLTQAAMASTNPLSIAVRTLIQAGHVVELVEGNVPGVFRVDGGPELTVGQVKSLAATATPDVPALFSTRPHGMLPPCTRPTSPSAIASPTGPSAGLSCTARAARGGRPSTR